MLEMMISGLQNLTRSRGESSVFLLGDCYDNGVVVTSSILMVVNGMAGCIFEVCLTL